MDIPALANMQKGNYLFKFHLSAMKIDLVSYFIEQEEQKGQEKDLECWGANRRRKEEWYVNCHVSQRDEWKS